MHSMNRGFRILQLKEKTLMETTTPKMNWIEKPWLFESKEWTKLLTISIDIVLPHIISRMISLLLLRNL